MVTVSKRTMTILIAVLMVAVIAVGATLAYLSNKTNTVVNHFSMVSPDDGVSGEIKEEGWDEDKDKTAMPGANFKKKVTVENTSDEDTYIWVAVKMTLTKGTTDPADPTDTTTTKLAPGDLASIVAIMSPVYNGSTTPWYNSAEWERKSTAATIQEHEIFYLKTKLAKNAESPQVFDSVKILDSATTEQIAAVYAFEGQGFNVVMSGAVVQALDSQPVLTDAIKADLDALLTYEGI